VEVLEPNTDTTVFDPCAGTGGFLLEAHDYILKNGNLDREQQKRLKNNLIF
jgi:type I restriction enzyme M protein